MLRRAFLVLVLPLGLSLPSGSRADLLIAGSSDTMPGFTESWVETFNARGGVQVVLEKRGTATAPAALQSGRAQIASMARRMSASETRAFRKARGREPLEIPVAIDAIAVLVHAGNPLERLSLPQVDAIFSATRNCGAGTDLSDWVALGLPDLASITIYGSRPGSGTGEFFRTAALCAGRFKTSLRVGSGPAATLRALAKDPAGIGFASRAEQHDGTRALTITNAPAARVEDGDLQSSAYPLTRQLLFYIDREPGAEFASGVREFVRFALSPEAQLTVESAGYLPLPRELAQQTLDRLR